MSDLFFVTEIVDGQRWSVLTNGHFAIFEAREPRADELSLQKLPAPKLAHLIGLTIGQASPLDRALIDRLRLAPSDTCGACDGTGSVECEECDGTGEVNCECRCGDEHEAERRECQGDKKVECACVAGKPGAPKPIPIELDGIDGVYDQRLISAVLERLPPDQPIGVIGASAVLVVRCATVYGAVMPMWKHTTAEAICSVMPLAGSAP